MSRLIFTVAVGKPIFGEMAAGLAGSLIRVGDTNRRAILTDLPGPWDGLYDEVIAPPGPRTALDKLLALDLTGADQVLSIDCDCLAFQKLDDVFEYCKGMPFAVQGATHSEGSWHGADVRTICARYGRESLPRFNGGLIYYARTPAAQELIGAMRNVAANYANQGFELFRGKASEEVCVLTAMLNRNEGIVIPDETDFMSTAVGLVGKLHMDISEPECWFLCRRARLRFIRPYIFHASRYRKFLIYWRQIDWLAKADK